MSVSSYPGMHTQDCHDGVSRIGFLQQLQRETFLSDMSYSYLDCARSYLGMRISFEKKKLLHIFGVCRVGILIMIVLCAYYEDSVFPLTIFSSFKKHGHSTMLSETKQEFGSQRAFLSLFATKRRLSAEFFCIGGR